MRTIGSAVLVILALLLAAVAGPSIWAERNVVSESGFVQLAGPLGDNREFQQGLTAVVAKEAAAQLNLPSQLQNLAAGMIASSAASLQSEPGYAQAWTQTLQRSHALTLHPGDNEAASGDLTLDVAPLVGLVATKISSDIGVKLPVPPAVLVNLDQPTVAAAIPVVTALGGMSGWLAFFAVDLFVLAVVVARKRALTTLLTGVGFALVALTWKLGAGALASQFARIGTGNDIAEQFGRELGQLAQESWQWGINVSFALAGGIIAAGVITLILGRRHTT